jgi:hypothetical protein
MIFDKKNIAPGGSVMVVNSHAKPMPTHHAAPQKGPAKLASQAHPRQPPPPQGHAAQTHPPGKPVAAKKPAEPKKGHGLIYSLLALTLIGFGAFFFLRHKGPAEPTPEALVAQIEDSAVQAAPKANVYGGMIFADHGSPPSVTVAGIPNKACVSAAWRLARSGIVTVNGAMPERISAAILAELCTQADGNAISWTPKKD